MFANLWWAKFRHCGAAFKAAGPGVGMGCRGDVIGGIRRGRVLAHASARHGPGALSVASICLPLTVFPVIDFRFVIRALLLGFFAVVGVGFWTPAQAHQTAMSTLNVEIRPDAREVDMLLAVSAIDLASFMKLTKQSEGVIEPALRAQLEPQFAAYLSPKLRAQNNGENCPASSEGFVQPDKPMAALFYRKTLTCDAPLGEVTLSNRVLLEEREGYTHYGRIQLGEDIHTTVFNPENPNYTVEVLADTQAMAEQSVFEVVSDFMWLGVLHIVLGPDHVLFVLCLLLAAGSFRRLIKVVTCFTLAHSITLVISALDIFSIAPNIVEPLIALSIIWVAVEIFMAEQRSLGAGEDSAKATGFSDAFVAGKHLFLLTFAFGLLHGFGFSYVLRDEVSLPTGALVPALFSFNLGVELGQIAVVCVAFPLILWMRKQRWGGRGVQALSAAVLAVALFWFVTRI